MILTPTLDTNYSSIETKQSHLIYKTLQLNPTHKKEKHKKLKKHSKNSIIMVRIHQGHINSEVLLLTGQTYDIRDKIKAIGGRWLPDRKCWQIANTPENKKAVKAMTPQRPCSHCGEVGHYFKKCPSYISERKEQLTRYSAHALKRLPLKFKMLGHLEQCSCEIIEKEFDVKGFMVKVPKVCSICSSWCCSKAKPIATGHPVLNFTCPCHGTSAEQYLNDTRGT